MDGSCYTIKSHVPGLGHLETDLIRHEQMAMRLDPELKPGNCSFISFLTSLQMLAGGWWLVADDVISRWLVAGGRSKLVAGGWWLFCPSRCDS